MVSKNCARYVASWKPLGRGVGYTYPAQSEYDQPAGPMRISVMTRSAWRSPRSPAAFPSRLATHPWAFLCHESAPPPDCRVGAEPQSVKLWLSQGQTGLPPRAQVAMLCPECGAETPSASLLFLPANTPTGAYMKLSISYKHVDA